MNRNKKMIRGICLSLWLLAIVGACLGSVGTTSPGRFLAIVTLGACFGVALQRFGHAFARPALYRTTAQLSEMVGDYAFTVTECLGKSVADGLGGRGNLYLVTWGAPAYGNAALMWCALVVTDEPLVAGKHYRFEKAGRPSGEPAVIHA